MLFRKDPLPPLVDLHSHILPDLDDGPQSEEEALELLWMAVRDGVMIQVLTPHFHAEDYPHTRQVIQERFLAFKARAEAARVPIELHLGAEVRLGPGLKQLVEINHIPWLRDVPGQRALLVELPPQAPTVTSLSLIHWLRRRQILPILAHPERHQELQRYPERIQPFVDAGCVLQITAASLLGGFGAEAQQAASHLLREGLAQVMASDCHDAHPRPPMLSQGVKAAAKLIGLPAALKLVVDNPLRLLSSQDNGPDR